MEHIVDSCPLTKLDGGLLSLHEADDDAISWLKMLATKALAKWMNEGSSNFSQIPKDIADSYIDMCPVCRWTLACWRSCSLLVSQWSRPLHGSTTTRWRCLATSRPFLSTQKAIQRRSQYWLGPKFQLLWVSSLIYTFGSDVKNGEKWAIFRTTQKSWS